MIIVSEGVSVITTWLGGWRELYNDGKYIVLFDHYENADLSCLYFGWMPSYQTIKGD